MSAERNEAKLLVRECPMCAEEDRQNGTGGTNHNLRVSVANVPALDGKRVAVEVSRCVRCDTRKCLNCEGRTLDPTAKVCRHCGVPITLDFK